MPTALLWCRSTGGMAGEGIQAARPIPHASDLDNTVTDNWSWLKGKHYFTAGITFVWNTKRQVSGQQTNGAFTFNGTFSAATRHKRPQRRLRCSPGVPNDASGLAMRTRYRGYAAGLLSAALARPATRLTAICMPSRGRRTSKTSIKFNKNLTFTLGLRIYHLPLPYGVPNSETNWVRESLREHIQSRLRTANAPTVNEFSGATNSASTPPPTATACSTTAANRRACR